MQCGIQVRLHTLGKKTVKIIEFFHNLLNVYIGSY